MTEGFNLYAIVGTPAAPRVLRISLSRALQKGLVQSFKEQYARFEDADTESVDFDGDFKADESEIFVVKGFDLHGDIRAALADPMSCALLNQATLGDDRIIGLMLGRSAKNSPEVYFQVFQRTQLITRERFSLFLSGDTFQRLKDPLLTLGENLVAVYRDNSLRFRSYVMLRRVLAVADLFRESTDKELEDFFSESCFDASQLGDLRQTSDQLIRRKVLILQQTGFLSDIDPKRVKKIGKRIDIPVSVAKGKIVLPGSKKELKELIRLLADDYLESMYDTARCYQTNSKRRVATSS